MYVENNIKTIQFERIFIVGKLTPIECKIIIHKNCFDKCNIYAIFGYVGGTLAKQTESVIGKNNLMLNIFLIECYLTNEANYLNLMYEYKTEEELIKELNFNQINK